mmetsp:Transcript_17133/g.25177  ORF Transcript_17133/g.25177 Transcript_17133/m.25177 type:complete len:212 (-) Transcript_17133:82-717(-)
MYPTIVLEFMALPASSLTAVRSPTRTRSAAGEEEEAARKPIHADPICHSIPSEGTAGKVTVHAMMDDSDPICSILSANTISLDFAKEDWVVRDSGDGLLSHSTCALRSSELFSSHASGVLLFKTRLLVPVLLWLLSDAVRECAPLAGANEDVKLASTAIRPRTASFNDTPAPLGGVSSRVRDSLECARLERVLNSLERVDAGSELRRKSWL